MGLPGVLRTGALQPARRALHEGLELPADLRDTIRLSWIRSKLAEVPTDRIELPHRDLDGAADRLVRAAAPILDRFAEQLADTRVSIVLADGNAQVIGRWAGDRSALRRLTRLSIDEGFVLAEDLAGTNGIGTVLEELRPVTIFGEEHYSEPLQGLVCAGAPIRNPLTRHIVGVLDLACPTAEATGLLIPTVRDLSRQIEQELSARLSARDRIVFEEFLARSRETPAALVGLSEHYMVTNAAAAELLDARDQPMLWGQVARPDGPAPTLVLASGAAIDARWTNVEIGSLLAGTIIEFARVTSPRQAPARQVSRPCPDRDLAEAMRLAAGGRICLLGETGTGKLTRARRIHELTRPDEPFTVLPSGLAAAEGAGPWLRSVHARLADPRGAVVIRNVEVLDDTLTQGLADLIDLQSGNRPLLIVTRSVDRGAERPALQGRFSDAVVSLRPLRQRRDELPDLVHGILRTGGHRTVIGHRAMAALVSFPWPGNFPQLQQVVHEAARRSGGTAIGIEHLPDEVAGSTRGRRQFTRLEVIERQAIVDALRETGGNRAKAAASLGLSRSTFYRRIAVFGLDSNRTLL
jgi:sigma-54 dependent transcriptional regulator, acetoin dehydrogenase operon transcriptional activator AcoR